MIESFEKRASDFVGPISPPSLNKGYILICIDFVTKWVEAKVVLYATKKYFINFLFEDIFVKFCVQGGTCSKELSRVL